MVVTVAPKKEETTNSLNVDFFWSRMGNTQKTFSPMPTLTRRRASILRQLQDTCINDDVEPFTLSAWTEIVGDPTFDTGPGSRYQMYNTLSQGTRGHCYEIQSLYRYMDSNAFTEPLDLLTNRPLTYYQRYTIMRQYLDYLRNRRARDQRLRDFTERCEYEYLHRIMNLLDHFQQAWGLNIRNLIIVLYTYARREIRFPHMIHRPCLNLPVRNLCIAVQRLFLTLRAHPEWLHYLRHHTDNMTIEPNADALHRAVLEVIRLLNVTPWPQIAG